MPLKVRIARSDVTLRTSLYCTFFINSWLSLIAYFTRKAKIRKMLVGPEIHKLIFKNTFSDLL